MRAWISPHLNAFLGSFLAQNRNRNDLKIRRPTTVDDHRDRLRIRSRMGVKPFDLPQHAGQPFRHRFLESKTRNGNLLQNPYLQQL